MHKFTIEYDISTGLFDDGRNHCLGEYGTLDEAEEDFGRCLETTAAYFNEVPIKKRRTSSYLVACYCWLTDEDGNVTGDDGWHELTEDEKKRIDRLNFSYGV